MPELSNETISLVDGETPERIPIITYHSIDDSGSIVSTSPKRFRRQIARLQAAGYRSLTLGRLVEILRSRSWPSEKSVVLTFDDGFENFYTEAAPVLAEYSFSATVFLVTDNCGGFNDWSGNPPQLPRSRLLSWEQIKELAEGEIEFGSHTLKHSDLTVIEGERASEEIVRSKKVIEDQLGRAVTSFAYPFGRFTPSVKRAVEDVYSAACSTNLGRIGPQCDMHSLRRIDAYYLSNPRSLDLLQSRWMDGYFAARQVLRNVKKIVGQTQGLVRANSN